MRFCSAEYAAASSASRTATPALSTAHIAKLIAAVASSSANCASVAAAAASICWFRFAIFALASSIFATASAFIWSHLLAALAPVALADFLASFRARLASTSAFSRRASILSRSSLAAAFAFATVASTRFFSWSSWALKSTSVPFDGRTGLAGRGMGTALTLRPVPPGVNAGPRGACAGTVGGAVWGSVIRRVVATAVVAVATAACSPVGGAGPAPTNQSAGGPTSTPSAVADSPVASGSPRPTPPTSPRPAPGTALAALATLRVAGRGALTGYTRAAFGPAWTDTDRNGCDTRNDILDRDLTSTVDKAGTHGCVILSGILRDPYTAGTIHFVRGGASEVDIDHVVALANAWVTGAARWPYAERVAFANDPLNLLAVDSSANRQKGDGDAATWLPSNKAFRCAYVARQVSVKAKFHLAVTRAEHDAMASVLGRCPSQPRLTGGNPTISTVTPPPPAKPPTTPGSSGSVYYANCTAARAAGAAPIYAGQPGYRSGLDRDHDGIACE
jgi:hypothetical protein